MELKEEKKRPSLGISWSTPLSHIQILCASAQSRPCLFQTAPWVFNESFFFLFFVVIQTHFEAVSHNIHLRKLTNPRLRKISRSDAYPIFWCDPNKSFSAWNLSPAIRLGSARIPSTRVTGGSNRAFISTRPALGKKKSDDPYLVSPYRYHVSVGGHRGPVSVANLSVSGRVEGSRGSRNIFQFGHGLLSLGDTIWWWWREAGASPPVSIDV